jgi:hypothetical protein
LSDVEVRRVAGAAACEAGTSGADCPLSAAALRWKDDANTALGGGRCEGMAVAALLMASGDLSVEAFGASRPAELVAEGNERLQRELAYWHVLQASPTSRDAERRVRPSELPDALVESFAQTPSFALGLYPDSRAPGHTVVPFALERAGEKLMVSVYDPNVPLETRALELDGEAWRFDTLEGEGRTPVTYRGNTTGGALVLIPASSRLLPQQCPFCIASSDETYRGR